MIRPCHIGVCRAVPVYLVALDPGVAGVAGAGACGTHITRVMRMLMVEYSVTYVRVRLIGADIASDGESAGFDHEIRGGAGDG